MRKLIHSLCFVALAAMVYLSAPATLHAAEKVLAADLKERVLSQYDGADRLGKFDEELNVWPVMQGDTVVGYAFETDDQVSIPAYSGKPVNVLVSFDINGIFKNSWVLEHHEPILLVGIPAEKLWDFAAQYIGKSITDKIRVGFSTDPEALTVDAVTGATVTVIVVNDTIMKSAHKVAVKLGLIEAKAGGNILPATVKTDVFSEADWTTLTGDGSIRRLFLDREQVDSAFKGTDGEGVEEASAEQKQDTFIDMYYTYLNAPTIGKNLLGEREYNWLMGELKEGEHAIAVMGTGPYSFKGNGYVRGGIFDRIQLNQGDDTVSFRDVDHHRLNDVYAANMPEFKEMDIFIIRPQFDFDPGTNWDIELLVRRQTGPLDSVFVSFTGGYQIPEAYIDRPVQPVVEAEEDLPIWISIWEQKSFSVTVLIISLVFLSAIIFMQDWLVRYPRLLHNIRRGFLLYTVIFIGWYALGQLSVVNVFTFTHAVMGDFRWELFLMDPIIFILWGFTAASILLWGRGIFCGWLCPFGAMQELINELARKLKIKQYELPFSVHERLWAVKYIILLALFGISLESMATAERYAEVEPFKTAILLAFQREWWFVTYAVTLLFISIFTRKVYCRYICPLGAALAIPTKLRLFDWLKRRKECGQPCQLCAVECEIQAIHPDGTINANECHHCLDCQMTYHNDNKCPPLVNKAKKARKKKAAPELQPINAVNVG
ncbi:transcriptional regulator NosR [Alkalimarinus sediminis]|uniref:NosR/NirI family protein n=1 Tax=Alkalimarinus sediminis TaxID=1632866 RepID=A0A9E8KP43_9ALTE|nr:NosR/NirI family protein [Alkalimarinus sediminis]UZW74359.1 NosR/NirI family protein [Alkalimarinus sediminis]